MHSIDTHLEKIISYIPLSQQVQLHLFTDGRDVPPTSALDLYREFAANFLSKYPNVHVATLGGRYFGMDRDTNWERIQKAYNEMVWQKNPVLSTPEAYIEEQYAKGITDEFIEPVSFAGTKPIQDTDAVFFVNYRSDRAKQLTKVFTDSLFSAFPTKNFQNLFFLAMTNYMKEYTGPFCLVKDPVVYTLGEVIAQNKLTQLHLAETEKFAHVTKFFNGDKDIKREGETDILIPSHKVATYDLDPEMSAEEIYRTFEKEMTKYDFALVNFANGDMVGHTGIMAAAQAAVQKLEDILTRMLSFCAEEDIQLFITADHGNCEEMGTFEAPQTSHTTNPVPFWSIKNREVVPLTHRG